MLPIPLRDSFVELIRRASTDLPQDVEKALVESRDREKKDSLARSALEEILENVALARQKSAPMCQDTGTNIWYVYYPATFLEQDLRQAIDEATREATSKSYLRPNAVNPLTGANSGDNTGHHAPVVHLHQWDKPYVQADLLLKGGGCENVSAQVALPDQGLKAGRDLDGVRRAVIAAIVTAQGRGCAPGYLGICIGGDRLTGHQVAKEMIFRLVHDENPERELAILEKQLLEELNTLGVGPMGFGGTTTVLGVKVGLAHRLPASYFVSIAYECWACRRATVRVDEQGAQFSQVAQVAEAFLANAGGEA